MSKQAPRARLLNAQEITDLLRAIPEPARDLVRAGMLTGLSLSDLQKLRVADFKLHHLELRRAGGQVKRVALLSAAKPLLATLAVGKQKNEWLFERFTRRHIGRRLRDVSALLDISPPLTFSDLRRQFDAVRAILEPFH